MTHVAHITRARLAELPALDLVWALDGYLWSPCRRRLQRVQDLDRLARDVLALGATVRWMSCSSGPTELCSVEARAILLDVRLLDHWPWFVRRMLSHGLAHLCAGESEAAALTWQRRVYGDIINPEDDL